MNELFIFLLAFCAKGDCVYTPRSDAMVVSACNENIRHPYRRREFKNTDGTLFLVVYSVPCSNS